MCLPSSSILPSPSILPCLAYLRAEGWILPDSLIIQVTQPASLPVPRLAQAQAGSGVGNTSSSVGWEGASQGSSTALLQPSQSPGDDCQDRALGTDLPTCCGAASTQPVLLVRESWSTKLSANSGYTE